MRSIRQRARISRTIAMRAGWLFIGRAHSGGGAGVAKRAVAGPLNRPSAGSKFPPPPPRSGKVSSSVPRPPPPLPPGPAGPPATDRHHAGTRNLDQAERQQQVDELIDLVRAAGDLEHEALGGGVDHAGAERIGEAECLYPVLALATHLDHGELALDRGARHRHID